MDAKTFFRELRRRNVYKVAVAYAVIAWLLVEAASIFFYGHEERTSAVTVLVVIVVLGFLVALYVSWAFEATPEGMKRTADLSPNEVLPTWSRKKFATFVLTIALLAAGLLVFDLLQGKQAAPPPAAATDH